MIRYAVALAVLIATLWLLVQLADIVRRRKRALEYMNYVRQKYTLPGIVPTSFTVVAQRTCIEAYNNCLRVKPLFKRFFKPLDMPAADHGPDIPGGIGSVHPENLRRINPGS